MLPRIVKATIKALLYFILLYVLPMFFISQLSEFAPELFARYVQIFNLFVAVVLFSVVASELTSGTIFQHAFNIGKAIILMLFFVLALNGGIMGLDFEMEGFSVHILADLRVYLAMLLAIDLLGLAKSVLQAVNFLSERTEKQLPTPKPS